ncbi:MAG TPA: TorF family putative porin [Rhodanobacteraceae bacterium]
MAGLLLAAGGLAGTAAQAAKPDASAVSGSVTVVSDYLFRGLSQTDSQPALQVGIGYTAPQGFHASAWSSNVSWLSDGSTAAAPISNSLEFDADVGWLTTFSHGMSLNAGLHGYDYPGRYPHGFTSPNTAEAYVGLGFAGLSLTYSHALTNLFGFDHSRNSRYLDLSWSRVITPGWTLSAHAGHQVVTHASHADYNDWNLALAHDFSSGCAVALGYYDTNAKRAVYSNARGRYLGRATAVLSLSKSF